MAEAEERIISFSGIDGSGKTALANRAYDYLRIEGIRATKFKVYASSTFFSIGRLIGKISKKTKVELDSKFASGDNRIKLRLGGLRRLCFRIDIIIFKLKMLAIKRRGPDLICDRYLYDTLIHLKYLKVVNESQYDFFLKRIPRPDLPILLVVSEDTAKKREAQHQNIEYYREKIQLYKQLGKEENLINIDSSSSLKTVWAKVKDIIDTKLKVK